MRSLGAGRARRRDTASSGVGLDSSPELESILDALAKAAGLPGRPGATGAVVDWERWLALTDENQLGPFLWGQLEARAGGPAWPPGVVRTLRDRYARVGLDASFRQTELMRVLRLLRGEAEPIVLKGAALVLTLYSEAAQRPMSDLDLLFPSPSAAARARAILEAEGYTTPSPSKSPVGHHHLPPLHHPIAEVTIELHTNLATPPISDAAIESLWARRRTVATPAGDAFVLDSTWLLLHHALHAIADPVDSPLLRNLFETAWLIAGLSPEERSAVPALAAEWGLTARIEPAVALARDLFGVPDVLQRSSAGARVAWSLRRIEWVGSFAAEMPWRARFSRSLARAHLGAIDRGADERATLPLVLLALSLFFQGLIERARRWFSRRPRPRAIELVRASTVEIEDRLLAHDDETGRVHLLDPIASRVFRAAAEEPSVPALVRRLGPEGIRASWARRALRTLLDRGLVRSRGGSTVP